MNTKPGRWARRRSGSPTGRPIAWNARPEDFDECAWTPTAKARTTRITCKATEAKWSIQRTRKWNTEADDANAALISDKYDVWASKRASENELDVEEESFRRSFQTANLEIKMGKLMMNTQWHGIGYSTELFRGFTHATTSGATERSSQKKQQPQTARTHSKKKKTLDDEERLTDNDGLNSNLTIQQQQ